MKQRIITALVGLLILGIVLAAFETVVLNAVVSCICLLAVFEVFKALGYTQKRLLAVPCFVYAVLVPFFDFTGTIRLFPAASFGLILVLLCVLLRHHQELQFQEVVTAGALSLLIPFSFATIVYCRNSGGAQQGLFNIFVMLGSAWFSDTGAYFTGRACGKHKLAPQISPHKTVEGLIGGLITAVLGNFFLAFLFGIGLDYLQIGYQIQWLNLFCVSLVAALAGVVGDLSASVLKRQTGVKDFGSIMPGHGGIMDRFDSVLLTAPIVFFLSRFLPILLV